MLPLHILCGIMFFFILTDFSNIHSAESSWCDPKNIIILKEINTVYSAACVNDGEKEMMALAGDTGCFLIDLPLRNDYTILQLHNYPTYNLITNTKKTEIGAFVEKKQADYFVAYSVITKKPIWEYDSFTTNAVSSNYAAAFSPVDDSILLYYQEQVLFNKKPPVNIPAIGNKNKICFAYHPDGYIAYLSSNQCLSLKWFNNTNATKCFSLDIPSQSGVVRIEYSSDYSLIGLLTDTKELFIYHADTMEQESLTIDNHCYDFKFIPKSSLMLIISNDFLSYYDIKNKVVLLQNSLETCLSDCDHNILINSLDTSVTGSHCSVVANNLVSTSNTPYRFTFFIYCFLRLYEPLSLPKDIISLIIKKLLTETPPFS
jgi:hypothetical protein